MESDARQANYVASEIVKGLNDAGFPARIETVNALEACLGSLPGHGYANLRRHLLSSANIADLLPTTGIWPGLATNPSQYFPDKSPALMWTATDGSTPFRLNLHDSDVGHTLVIGQDRCGEERSHRIRRAQWMRYPGAQLFYFDYGYSAWLLATACGWPHYAIGAGRIHSLGLQPLGGIDDAAERAWAAEWLDVVFSLHGITLTSSQRARNSEWRARAACVSRYDAKRASNHSPRPTLSTLAPYSAPALNNAQQRTQAHRIELRRTTALQVLQHAFVRLAVNFAACEPLPKDLFRTITTPCLTDPPLVFGEPQNEQHHGHEDRKRDKSPKDPDPAHRAHRAEHALSNNEERHSRTHFKAAPNAPSRARVTHQRALDHDCKWRSVAPGLRRHATWDLEGASSMMVAGRRGPHDPSRRTQCRQIGAGAFRSPLPAGLSCS